MVVIWLVPVFAVYASNCAVGAFPVGMSGASTVGAVLGGGCTLVCRVVFMSVAFKAGLYWNEFFLHNLRGCNSVVVQVESIPCQFFCCVNVGANDFEGACFERDFDDLIYFGILVVWLAFYFLLDVLF